MLKNLHEQIFPILSNFTLVVYDIGLSNEEHKEYKKYCKCTLLKYPFDKLPAYFEALRCFGWKPVVIRAHYDKANFIIWQDASVRYNRPNWLLQALRSADICGVLQHRSGFVRNPFRAMPSTFHFFGDTPCAHLAFTQAESNWGIYRNSPLVKLAILDSWVACGLNASCTCPKNPTIDWPCPHFEKELGMCMRPQSAITILLSKLYMEHYEVTLTTGDSSLSIRRGNLDNYFEQLKKK